MIWLGRKHHGLASDSGNGKIIMEMSLMLKIHLQDGKSIFQQKGEIVDSNSKISDRH